MKNLSIKGIMILVVALAFAVPAGATSPTTVSGSWAMTDPSPTVAMTGALEGVVTHAIEHPRVVSIQFVGSVLGVCGKFDATMLKFTDSLETELTINQGSGGLETLRGRGSVVVTGFNEDGLPFGTYEMDVHFDPNYPEPSPAECS